MAAVLPIVMGGLSLIGSISKTIGERKRELDMERALDKMKYKQLSNVTNDIGVSTLKAENRQREVSRGFATTMDALRSSGTRALVGGAAGVLSSYDETTSDITADLDMQREKINTLKALDAQRIRDTEEARTLAEIGGLSSGMNAARTGKNDGLTSIFSSLGVLGASLFPEKEEAVA